MKIRNGFVSNSSSSSFVILSKEPITKEKLMQFFKIPENSPLYFLSKSLANTVINCCNQEKWESLDDWYKKRFLENITDPENWNIYTGSFCDDAEAEERMLCDMDLNIITDNIIIKKDGGY